MSQLVALLWLAVSLPTALSQGQAPALVATTSCRSSPISSISLPTQPMTKPSIPAPALTSTCVTTSRPARVSLFAQKGVFANIYDAWGTCDQFIPFEFNEGWTNYAFSMAYYDDPQQGCTGTPTATMACSIGVNGQLQTDETFKIAPTEPHAAAYDASQTGAGWVTCMPVEAAVTGSSRGLAAVASPTA